MACSSELSVLSVMTLLLTAVLPADAEYELIHFPHGKPKPGHCCPIGRERLWMKEVVGLDKSSSNELKRLLGYQFYLPHIQLKSGLASYGASRRLRKFVSMLLKGTRPLKLGAVGGSITWGHGTSSPKSRWFNVFTDWLVSVSGSNVTAHNGCVPATPSAYMVICLGASVDPDVDLVFVEYSLNDGVSNPLVGNRIVRAMEQLVRRILDLPGRPAVVLVQVPHVWTGAYEPFYHTSEDMEGAVCGYYDVPSVSLRNALYPLAVLYPTDGFLWNQTYNGMHPGDSGHKILADLAVHLIQETARDLLLDPLTPEEELELERPLPAPLYPGNLAPEASTCVTGDDLQELMTLARGWSWVNTVAHDDGRGRWGFKATEPGSTLRLQVDTRWRGVLASKRLPLLIHYRKADQDMGMALVECLSGCECEPLQIDAGLQAYHSQLVMAALRVSQHRECELQLSLLNDTNSGGTTFMVTGVSVVGSPDYSGDLYKVNFWNDQHQ